MAAGLSRHWALEIVVLLTAGFVIWHSSCWDQARNGHTGQLAERATALIEERYACKVPIPAPLFSKALPNGPLGGPLGPWVLRSILPHISTP